MTWKFNVGLGAYLCDNCRTMVCEDVGTTTPLDDARMVHRLSAVVGKQCGRLFCSPKCAARGGLSANEYAPAFSPLRVACGTRLGGNEACAAVGAWCGISWAAWFRAAWKYVDESCAQSKLAFCERLRDAVEVRDQIDAAARLGGYQAALPLLVEFAASIRWRYVGSV